MMPVLIIGCGKKSPPTLKAYEIPKQVQQLQAERLEDEVLLSWDYPSPDIKRIKGFILTKTHRGKEEHISLGSDIKKFKDLSIKEGETYEYRIRAVNSKDIPGPYSERLVVKVCPMPEPPEELTYRVHRDSVEIIWGSAEIRRTVVNKCQEPIRYNLYRTQGFGALNLSPLNDKPIESNSIRVPVDLHKGEPNKKAYFSIRPTIRQGITHTGRASKVIAVSPEDFVPSSPLFIDTTINNGRVYLNWQEAPETWVRGYRVYRRDAEGNFVVVGETQTPFFTEHIGKVQMVHYRVTSLGPSRESLPSERIIANDR